jgi:hypothetical protein
MTIEKWSLSRRLDFIQQLQSTVPSIGQKQLEFQEESKFFDVYKVEIGFPCYRLTNGRTRAEQLEIIANQGLEAEYFTADPDSEAALEYQEKILLNMVTTGTEQQITNILRHGQQTDALILDSNGYVINGNRRLCVMRYLLEEDEIAYERYKHVQVLFLPPCGQNDIDELEARLQWQPEGRSDYSWVAKAITLRQRQEVNWSMERMSRFYKLTQAEIQLQIAILGHAEGYLEKLGLQQVYSKVLNKQFAFEQLHKSRKKCLNDEPKKQFFTNLAYVMMDDAESTGGRLYDSIPDALKSLSEINSRLQEEFSDGLPGDRDEVGDGLELLGSDTDSDYEHTASILREPNFGEDVRNIVRDTIQEMQQNERERRDATYCLRELQKASTALLNARNSIDLQINTSGINPHLDNIEETSKKIREILSNGQN